MMNINNLEFRSDNINSIEDVINTYKEDIYHLSHFINLRHIFEIIGFDYKLLESDDNDFVLTDDLINALNEPDEKLDHYTFYRPSLNGLIDIAFDYHNVYIKYIGIGISKEEDEGRNKFRI